jgi:hypothetical protein
MKVVQKRKMSSNEIKELANQAVALVKK